MNSDIQTLIPSLLEHIDSDLFTLENISSSTNLSMVDTHEGETLSKWEVVLGYLPMSFFRLIETMPAMTMMEEFDSRKYKCNPKKYAFDKYETTNMWRPIMILNRQPMIQRFDFKYIRYYNITEFSRVLEVLIARTQNAS